MKITKPPDVLPTYPKGGKHQYRQEAFVLNGSIYQPYIPWMYQFAINPPIKFCYKIFDGKNWRDTHEEGDLPPAEISDACEIYENLPEGHYALKEPFWKFLVDMFDEI